jgi:hypothetical protein
MDLFIWCCDKYPGTAVERMRNARVRAQSLSQSQLCDEWERCVLILSASPPFLCSKCRSSPTVSASTFYGLEVVLQNWAHQIEYHDIILLVHLV